MAIPCASAGMEAWQGTIHAMKIDTVREYREAPTFRHGVARHVMGRVNVLLAGEPARRVACAARLSAEYGALPVSVRGRTPG